MSSPDPPAADFATRRERSFADQSRTTGKKPPGPPLAQVSTDSGNLLFDRSIDLPDALGSGHTFCVSPHHGQLGMIGNVLGFVMDYACPVYDPFRPPRNWVAYIHLHSPLAVDQCVRDPALRGPPLSDEQRPYNLSEPCSESWRRLARSYVNKSRSCPAPARSSRTSCPSPSRNCAASRWPPGSPQVPSW